MTQIHKKLLFIVMIIAGFSSCKKNFLDVNNDPNRVTDANITPELIFPQAANSVGQRASSGNFLFLDQWMGYVAQNGTFAPQQDLLTYNIDFSFGDALFQNHYHVIFDLHQAEVKGYASGDTTLSAASIILSAKLYQELVDLYGNIPYSQAFNVATYTHPTYDKAQDIYNSLQKRLDTAIMYMGLTAPKIFSAANIVKCKGGPITQAQWIKFANTLKLRLLIRQSQVAGFDQSAEIAKIQNTGGVLLRGESVSVNPGFVNDVNKQNSYYSNYGWTPTGVVSTSADNANAYIINILKSTTDPRLGRLFYPVGFTGSNFVGAVFGAALASVPTGPNLSYFGPALVGNINGSNSGDGSGAAQDQFIYPSYESLFLYAEAVARGWIVADATAAYVTAVQESFSWLGVPNADGSALNYIANNSATADFANAGSTPFSKAQFIAYQKYIANTAIDPLESYSDLRRLHFLTDNSYISVAPGKLSPTLPLRLLYPQSEYTTNSTNVLKEGTILPFTTKLFWEP